MQDNVYTSSRPIDKYDPILSVVASSAMHHIGLSSGYS